LRGSWRIGTFFGIGVYLHFTFLLLLAFLTWAEYQSSGSLATALLTLAFFAAFFLCLIMHEYGHALTARKFGIRTRDITLLPIGGVARLERMPDKPWQEFLVAIAGPMVNVVIAAVLLAGLSIAYSFAAIRPVLMPMSGLGSGNIWLNLAKLNILLVLFNMLPAFPMDGGRVVRSLMAMVLPYERATAYAAILGKIMAVLFGLEVFGLNTIPYLNGESNFILGIIAIFIWIGAGSEARFVTMKSRLHDVPVSRAMVTNFRTLSPRDTIEWVSELAASGLQQDFPVAEEGRVVGMLYQPTLIAAMQRQEPYMKVGDVMLTDVPTVNSTDRLEDVFADVIGSRVSIVPVTNRGLLVGLLPLDRLVRTPPPGSGGQPAPGQAAATR
jgi:Zn-dependent protease/CBS domain-containing protein